MFSHGETLAGLNSVDAKEPETQTAVGSSVPHDVIELSDAPYPKIPMAQSGQGSWNKPLLPIEVSIGQEGLSQGVSSTKVDADSVTHFSAPPMAWASPDLK